MRYNGRLHEGEIADGKWIVEGQSFDSPSGAASGIAVTKKGRKTKLDGWILWHVRLPGETTWMRLDAVRDKTDKLQGIASPEALGL